MSKFTFKVVNNRGDETQLNLMLTATSDSGLEGIQLGKSTLVKDFFAGNPSHSFSAETFVVGRLYVGYGEMPPAPDPNSNQYYGWVEFSRNNVDKGVYLNLSNVDIVGLPLTLKGKLADDGKPFSLGMSFAISRDCSVRLSNLNMSSKSQAMQTRSKLELLRSANETSECDNGDQRLEGASSFPL